MPIFDFVCKECGKQFDVKISNAEKSKVKCPECNSSNLKQLLAFFNTGGSKSSRTTSFGQSCSVNNCGT